jgi:hypothetical protein
VERALIPKKKGWHSSPTVTAPFAKMLPVDGDMGAKLAAMIQVRTRKFVPCVEVVT